MRVVATRAAAVLLLAGTAHGSGGSQDGACSTGSGAPCGAAAAPELDDFAALQAPSKQRRSQRSSGPSRIKIVDKKLMQEDAEGTMREVLPLGGNYVIKAQPYFPPAEVVRANARSMRQGAEAMTYKPQDGRVVVPMVRLGTTMEGAMPHGPALDKQWVADLERTLSIFAEEGVYVVLDSHTDCWSSSNGGEGIPYWIPKYMQQSCPNSYVVSPKHPLETVIPEALEKILLDFKVPVPTVKVMENDTDPWLAYSIEDKRDEPWKMNIGNRNVRLNNDDEQWSAGLLQLSRQSNNIATRFYNSHTKTWPKDREQIFDPFVDFMRYLGSVWDKFPNVIAVEILNEPPLAGLPNLAATLVQRRDLFDFYSALLTELDDVPAVFAFEDIVGGVPGVSPLDLALDFVPISKEAMSKITEWAGRGQLIYSYHYYFGMESTLNFTAHNQVALSGEFAKEMPLFLSEFWDAKAEVSARHLEIAANLGVNMITYWQYVDTSYTGNGGWFKYPDLVQQAGGPMASEAAWAEYSKTVEDSTYWGAAVCGASGGHDNVLRLV